MSVVSVDYAPERRTTSIGPGRILSVLLPVFNASRYLRQALDSLWVQSLRDFEVIAIDDGSTDGSLSILLKYAAKDARVHVISRSNTGIVGALNDGLKECEGEFVARMDADDVCLPERLAQQVGFLSSNPDCVALGTDVLYTDPEGAPLIRHRPALDHSGIVSQLLDGNGGAMIHPSVMFRRRALERVGGYRERYQWIEDLDLYIRLSEMGSLANLPDVHLHYRQHLRSVNRTKEKKDSLRREIVDSFRQKHGLQPLPKGGGEGTENQSQADWRRHWAFDAARGGHWDSARKNAVLALRSAPLEGRNWSCWRYVRSAARKARTPAKALLK
jgi:glycosyltransferase involved in cell wall biosynthesis